MFQLLLLFIPCGGFLVLFSALNVSETSPASATSMATVGAILMLVPVVFFIGWQRQSSALFWCSVPAGLIAFFNSGLTHSHSLSSGRTTFDLFVMAIPLVLFVTAKPFRTSRGGKTE